MCYIIVYIEPIGSSVVAWHGLAFMVWYLAAVGKVSFQS